jgi:hypothetical protein
MRLKPGMTNDDNITSFTGVFSLAYDLATSELST